MAFYFKRQETVARAIRRLGGKRVQSALERLKTCTDADAIHCARKDIKMLRALLRLVRAGIAKKQFRRLAGTLRQSASQLAAPRDAYIKTEALQDLTRRFKGQLAPRALPHLHAQLRNDLAGEMKRLAKGNNTGKVERELRRVGKKFDCLNLSRTGWSALGPGVKAAYRNGRRAYAIARKNPSPESLHQWRKRAKDLWYQIGLLRPIWPEQMEATSSELKGLTDYLGDDHDLVVLGQAAREQCSGDANAREVEILTGLIAERRRELRSAALALGARIYAEKPSTFCGRLAEHWKARRSER